MSTIETILDNSFFEIYPNSDIAQKAYVSFKEQVYSPLLENEELISKANTINSEIFNLISEFSLSKFFVSITTSNSIFYRFAIFESNLEFKLEVFFDYDVNDESDIQSTLHVYDGSIKEGAYFGAIDYLYKIIISKVYANRETEANYFKLTSPSPKLELAYYSCPVSPAFNSYQ